MNQIDQLIAKLCPGGVEYMTLGNVAQIKTGSAVSKQAIEKNPGPYPVINSGKEPLGYIGVFNTEGDPLGVTSRGAGVGSITWYDGQYFRGNLNYGVTVSSEEQIDVRFLYYVLLHLQPKIQALCSFQGIPALNKANLEKLRIPVPPLEVQRAIVEILDKFTALEAELEAELEARKKQYGYYRRSILSSIEEESENIALSEIGTWYGGGTPSKSKPEYWEHGTIPWISPKDMSVSILTKTQDYITETAVRESSTKAIPRGSVALVVRSSILDHTLPIAYIDVAASLNQDMKAVVPHDGISAKYVFHALRALDKELLLRVKRSGGSVASLESGKLRNFTIPIPSMDRQRHVVSILDNFDALVNDLSSGLPAEITARRKQYEHYRDQLLTFKELAS